MIDRLPRWFAPPEFPGDERKTMQAVAVGEALGA